MTVSCHTHKNIRNCEKGPHTKERKMRIGDKRHAHTHKKKRERKMRIGEKRLTYTHKKKEKKMVKKAYTRER